MPVSVTVRWATILLAGLSWPFAYALKLGQVGPLLFLLFAIGWRWLDAPLAVGASAAARCDRQDPAGPRTCLGSPDAPMGSRRRRR